MDYNEYIGRQDKSIKKGASTMIGTNHTHLFRHFDGGRIVESPRPRCPAGLRDMEYLGYVATFEYDGRTHRSFIRAAMVSERMLPTYYELIKYEA